MKLNLSLFFTVILLAISSYARAQNLISNGDFQNNDLTPRCDGWFNNCEEELSVYCDTNLNCFVGLVIDPPTLIPEYIWCLKIKTYFAPEGYAETYITGQTGTNIYKLSYFMKAVDWQGGARIGIGKHEKFVESKSQIDTTSTWKEFSFTDTITTQATDTITVRLTADLGDFCVCPPVRFGLINLVKLEPDATSEIPSQKYTVETYPNPSSRQMTIEVKDSENTPLQLDIFNVLGEKIISRHSSEQRFTIDKSETGSGIFFYHIQSVHNKEINSHGKILFD